MSWLDDLLANIQGTSPEAKDYKSDVALNKAGSVMGSEKTGQRGTGHPLLDTVNEIMGVANPINWMGGVPGASEAIIAPTRSKLLQGLWQQAKNVAPKLVERAESDPRTLYSYLTQSMLPGKSLGTYQDLTFGPQVQKLMPEGYPTPGSAQVWGGQSKNEMLSTLLHEMTHFLTSPTLKGKNPEHAFETAQQLGNMMPLRQRVAMSKYAPPSGLAIKDPETAYTEALSYLTESLLEPAGRGADPFLGLVADALGHGLR